MKGCEIRSLRIRHPRPGNQYSPAQTLKIAVVIISSHNSLSHTNYESFCWQRGDHSYAQRSESYKRSPRKRSHVTLENCVTPRQTIIKIAATSKLPSFMSRSRLRLSQDLVFETRPSPFPTCFAAKGSTTLFRRIYLAFARLCTYHCAAQNLGNNDRTEEVLKSEQFIEVSLEVGEQ